MEILRHGLTAVHFSPDGLCAFGHRLEVPLPTRLAAWIEAENLAPAEYAAEIAESTITAAGEHRVTTELAWPVPGFLRDAVIGIASLRGLRTAAEAAAPADLTAKLAAWIEEQGVQALDSPEALARRVIASLGPAYVAERLASGATEYLHGAAERYADPTPLTDRQFAAEMCWHGHDPY
jgi:hypothetical protein